MSQSVPAASASKPSETVAPADYDVLIVGTGSAGVAAAIRASELGASVAIVERAEVIGGTCVNVGCIPSKFVVEAAQHFHASRTGFPGIAASEPQLAWDQLLASKREIVASLRRQKYTDVLQAYQGITVLHGHASLRPGGSPDAVAVRIDERDLHVKGVVLATGTRPAMPPIPGLTEAGPLDSTTVMELQRLPASLLVLGAGSIGLELGQSFQRFGTRVIVVEAMERILPGEDPDVSTALTEALVAEGMDIHVGTRVTRVERTDTGVRLHVQQGNLVGLLEAEELLVATGRVPNTETLNLEAAGIRTDDRGFVTVDSFMRTSNPRVFAAGDVAGGPGFVYVAAHQGGVATQALLADIAGAPAIPSEPQTVPRVTFTDPQVAVVGLSDVEARATGASPNVTSLPVEYLPRAAVSLRRRGVIKLVEESGTGRLLGAHVIAPNAGDMIGEAVLAVRFGLTTSDLVSTLHPYLTWGEALKLAAQTFTQDVAKLSCCA